MNETAVLKNRVVHGMMCVFAIAHGARCGVISNSRCNAAFQTNRGRRGLLTVIRRRTVAGGAAGEIVRQ
jgi:hypothetical protein